MAALARYQLRAAGRPTPFGLFAGVAGARFGGPALVRFGEAHRAAARVDAPGHGARLGAIGHGPNGAVLAERLCRHIDTWDADRTAKPSITIYPDSAPQTTRAQVITREHCKMTVVY